ncbi:hypothetical protein HYU15_03315 [Candidatus Woesearchaeota archaeon]|nr:hypothetical protein [Candidatus Woesearchaeota archaeon]
MKKEQQVKFGNDVDPFEILDSLMPPEKPTRKVSEAEWKKMVQEITKR